MLECGFAALEATSRSTDFRIEGDAAEDVMVMKGQWDGVFDSTKSASLMQETGVGRRLINLRIAECATFYAILARYIAEIVYVLILGRLRHMQVVQSPAAASLTIDG